MAKFSFQNRVAKWLEKQDPSICCLQDTHFRCRGTHRLKVKVWKSIPHANGNQKKAEVATLVSEKTDFKTKTVIEKKV